MENQTGYLGEYLRWKGNLTFEQAPFSDADSLALTMLSYLNPEEVTAPEKNICGMRLPELARRYDLFYVPRKNPGKLSMTARAPELLALMASTVRFSGVTLEDYTSYTDDEMEGCFAAMTFSTGRDSIYIAYRGTDDRMIGWKEDFNMSYLESVPAQKSAAAYLKKQAEVLARGSNSAGKIFAGGHSKGGNLAVYAAVCAGGEAAGLISEIHNFDGPGFSADFFRFSGYAAVEDKIVNFMPQGSLVGMLFEHGGAVRIVRSDARGILQHVPFSWKIEGGNFLAGEGFHRSSLIFREMMAAWISGKNDKEKKIFIDAIFGVLQKSGIETTGELRHDIMKIGPVFRLLHRMSGEERDTFFRFIAALAREAGLAVQKNFLRNAGEAHFREETEDVSGRSDIPSAH